MEVGHDLTRHNELKHLWSLRISVLLTILKAGVSVVQSDVDVVWHQKPSFPRTYHIVSSLGAYPNIIQKEWG